jgi:ABC-2 type transport system ATP-binding protein
MGAMIEVHDLTKYYGSAAAIRGVSFRVAAGEILGFLGPNAAGKTTTMRILAGCLAASEGTARVAGYDVFEQSLEARRSLGYLPELVPLYPEMGVEEYLAFAGSLRGMTAQALPERLDEVLARCGLVEVRGKLIGRLSKGYRQRVGLAQAMLHDPPVLILDEPTVGLDPRQIIEVRELIRGLANDHTVLLSTHILPEVSTLCSRVVIIDHGRVVAEDTPENLEAVVPAPGGAAGRERLLLEVEGPPEAVAERLRGVPGVVDVQVASLPLAAHRSLLSVKAGSALTESSELRAVSCFTVQSSPGDESAARSVRRAVAAAVVSAGYGLLELRAERLTLEDIFVRLVTEERTALGS